MLKYMKDVSFSWNLMLFAMQKTDFHVLELFCRASHVRASMHRITSLELLRTLKLCLTLMGRLYRRRYQLVFFKTSAKDIKNTPSILVVQISVIHQLKLWSVYFFCVHSRIQQNFVVLEKKRKQTGCALCLLHLRELLFKIRH